MPEINDLGPSWGKFVTMAAPNGAGTGFGPTENGALPGPRRRAVVNECDKAPTTTGTPYADERAPISQKTGER